MTAPSAGDPSPHGLQAAIAARYRPLDLARNPYIDPLGPLWGRFEDGRFSIGLPVEERHCSPSQMAHGGLLMTLADMQLVLGANFQTGLTRFMSTVNLSADFIAPIPVGEFVAGELDVLRVTRNLVFAQGLLRVGDQVVLRFNGICKPIGDPNPRYVAPRWRDG